VLTVSLSLAKLTKLIKQVYDISAKADGPHDADSCKIDHITLHAVCNRVQATSVGLYC